MRFVVKRGPRADPRSATSRRNADSLARQGEHRHEDTDLGQVRLSNGDRQPASEHGTGRSVDNDRSSLDNERAARSSVENAGVAHAVAFATTEHFNLQTARALTVTESNGRANVYLAVLSSSLIVLAFVGQTSNLGTAFLAFALILLPVAAFVGVVTFLRLIQSSIEDIAYAHRIALLRTFYLRIAPQLGPYLVTVRSAEESTPPEGGRLRPSSWQLALTVAGMVAVVNSVVIGSCAALAVTASGIREPLVFASAGAVIAASAFAAQERHHRHAFDAYRPDAVDRVAVSIAPPET